MNPTTDGPTKFTLTIEEHPVRGWGVTCDAHRGFLQTIMPEEGLPEGLRQTPRILCLLLVKQMDADRAKEKNDAQSVPVARKEGIPVMSPTTPGVVDTIDANLRQYLGSLVATEAALNVWRALYRGGHLKEGKSDKP